MIKMPSPVFVFFSILLLTKWSFSAHTNSRQPITSAEIPLDEMSLSEQKKALRELFNTIDTNNDNKLDGHELETWIVLLHNVTTETAVKSRFQHLDINEDEYVSWSEMRNVSFALQSDGEELDPQNYTEETFNLLQRTLKSDRKTFQVADLDKNDKLDLNEFRAFAAPELFSRMHFHMIEETIENLDSDSDGELSVNEYLSAIVQSKEELEDNDSINREYDYFFSNRDKDKSGKLDRNEVFDWIIGGHEDIHKTECDFLIRELDANKDGSLSKDEVLNEASSSMFIYSSATNFGRGIPSHIHKEL